MIISDDTGYWDLGAYLGGAARGMSTPNLDWLAAEGMMFTDFYAQASCTPGRAAMQTGRNPNRSGMTTVAFQGQGGGLPAAERLEQVAQSYQEYPPRPLQSDAYAGPMTISRFRAIERVREILQERGVDTGHLVE